VINHKEQIFSLRKEGKTYSEIQKILGCSKGTISYHLGDGQKEKTKKRMHKSRAEIFSFISSYKEQMGCVDCGEMYPYFMLQFDHLHSKDFQISNYRKHTVSLDKIKKEIDKCEVVCANCHSIRTHMRRTTGDIGEQESRHPSKLQ
jgi:DNA-binding CsgD family transcriptional regulator